MMNNIDWYKPAVNCCPNCGARMEGDSDAT